MTKFDTNTRSAKSHVVADVGQSEQNYTLANDRHTKNRSFVQVHKCVQCQGIQQTHPRIFLAPQMTDKNIDESL